MGVRFKLWQEKRALAPSKVFKRALMNKLSVAYDARYGRAKLWQNNFKLKLATTGLVAVFVSLNLATGVYAYTAPEVTEGSVLYPVKQTLEAVEGKIQFTNEARAKFLVKKANRRQAELNVLKRQQKNAEKIEAKIEKIEDDLAKINDRINLEGNYKDTEIKAAVENKLKVRKEKLERKMMELNSKKDKVEKEVLGEKIKNGDDAGRKFKKKKNDTND